MKQCHVIHLSSSVQAEHVKASVAISTAAKQYDTAASLRTTAAKKDQLDHKVPPAKVSIDS